jgi:iodotyrosine deiodinase
MTFATIPYAPYDPKRPPEEAVASFREILSRRRSVRDFSDKPVSRKTIEELVLCATSAPSGANKQPWRFVAVADQKLKAEIRRGAEAEEREFYERRGGFPP